MAEARRRPPAGLLADLLSLHFCGGVVDHRPHMAAPRAVSCDRLLVRAAMLRGQI